ncbi:MAG: hypothetical protein KGI33_01630 [Thaumarchaeota archaeon]|nr:hypothetical protein [Nitrososphaerota archaeon]
MRIISLFPVLALAAFASHPALADVDSMTIKIAGGSEASQDCVAAKDCYDPGMANVPPRTIVTWTNMDTTAHTVTSGDPSGSSIGSVFDSGQIPPGGTYSFMFMSSGTYRYFCTIHPWMTGEVLVGGHTAQAGVAVPEFAGSSAVVLAASVLFAAVLGRRALGF